MVLPQSEGATVTAGLIHSPVMQTFLSTPVGSFLKVFVSIVLGAALADLSGLESFEGLLDGWQGWVIAGLSSALPVIINYLNPADPRYGKTPTSRV